MSMHADIMYKRAQLHIQHFLAHERYFCPVFLLFLALRIAAYQSPPSSIDAHVSALCTILLPPLPPPLLPCHTRSQLIPWALSNATLGPMNLATQLLSAASRSLTRMGTYTTPAGLLIPGGPLGTLTSGLGSYGFGISGLSG